MKLQWRNILPSFIWFLFLVFQFVLIYSLLQYCNPLLFRCRWGLCELRDYPRFPWIWGRADRLGGTPKTDRCVLQRKVWLGKKKEGWVSIVNRVRSGFFFCFQDGEVVRVVYGCSERPRQKEPGPRISSDWRPTDLKCCFVRSSWSQSPKNIRVCGAFFFLGRLTVNILKFPVEFNKNSQKQKKPAAESWSPAKHSADVQFVSLSYRCSACHRVSLPVTGQISLRNVAGGEEEKGWVFAPESDNCNVVILVPDQVNTQSAKRATSVLPKSNESSGAESLPSWTSPFEFAASGGFCATTYSWLEARSGTDVDILFVGLVMGPKRRRIESVKKLVFSVGEWQNCSCQFACHPEPFAWFLYARTRLFMTCWATSWRIRTSPI